MTQPPPAFDDVLDAKDVAALLKIGKSSVYVHYHAGELRGIRIGHILRFRLSAVEAFLAHREAASNPSAAAAD